MINSTNTDGGEGNSPIKLEPKGGVTAPSKVLSTCVWVGKMYCTPPEFESFVSIVPDFYQSYFEIENILSEDNHHAFIFPILINKTKKIISNIPENLKLDFIEKLALRVTSYRIEKLKELKYDTSFYIDHTPRYYGNHTEFNRFVKAPKENIDIKLNLLTEYEKWLSDAASKEKPMIDKKGTSISTEGVLVRADYFNIIKEIYSLHRNTLNNYLDEICQKHLPKNPEFVQCLFKDINKIMEGVHGPNDLDLDLSTGDLQIEFGEIKLTGNPLIFDDAILYLWMRMLTTHVKKHGHQSWNQHRKQFEEEFLTRDDYSPPYLKQIKALNSELKKHYGSKAASMDSDDVKTHEINDSTRKRYKQYVDEYNKLTQVKKMAHNKAAAKVCEAFGISEKTLMRAIRSA